MTPPCQLISYIAPGAPATRRYATGDEPFLRPEIGFTPKWFRDAIGIDFGEDWHTRPAYRLETIRKMREELRRRFPGTNIGGIATHHAPLDVLTGTFGACTIAGIYGLPVIYHEDNWPIASPHYLNDDAFESIEPPDLDSNPFFRSLLDQLEWIADAMTIVAGFVNWQGVLNNAHRLRGEALFTDLLTAPDQCRRLFECVCTTMIAAAKRVHAIQRASGYRVGFFTVSNCLVNLVSPEIYRDLLLPLDRRIAREFGCIGVHNCAWTVDPYVDAYAAIEHVGYVDMGLESNLRYVRNQIPAARRAVMYRPTELQNKSTEEIYSDLDRIACELGPCDVVFADIESGTPDQRILDVVAYCDRLSRHRPHPATT